MSDTME